MDFNALHRRTERLPMLRALVPFAAGIALEGYFTLPAGFVWAAFLLSGMLALTFRSSLCTAAALLLFGWGTAAWRTVPQDALPRGTRTVFSLTATGGGTGRITAWRDAEAGVWRAADAPVLLRSDSSLTLRAGERLVFRGYLNELPEQTSYGKLMRRRGYAGRVWLSEQQILTRSAAQGTTLHAAAAAKLRRLGLPEREHALCAAMAAGDRSSLTPGMRRAFARSGTSHLLAVSGLHVGIVFLLVNALLGWLPLLRRGHLLRNGAAIALIWLYAATAGLSPSVVRAALMFSALQLSLAAASAYVSGNVLAATAFVMLLFRPACLSDISFQLSFTAVAGILAWGVPLCRRLHTRFRLLNLLTDTLAVGFVATAATTPLAAHTFGIVPLAGLFVNPLAIPLAMAAVLGSVVWLLSPGFLAPLLRLVAGPAAAGLNALVTWAAAWPFAAFEWAPTAGQTAGIYLFFILLTLAAWCKEPKKPVSLQP